MSVSDGREDWKYKMTPEEMTQAVGDDPKGSTLPKYMLTGDATTVDFASADDVPPREGVSAYALSLVQEYAGIVCRNAEDLRRQADAYDDYWQEIMGSPRLIGKFERVNALNDAALKDGPLNNEEVARLLNVDPKKGRALDRVTAERVTPAKRLDASKSRSYVLSDDDLVNGTSRQRAFVEQVFDLFRYTETVLLSSSFPKCTRYTYCASIRQRVNNIREEAIRVVKRNMQKGTLDRLDIEVEQLRWDARYCQRQRWISTRRYFLWLVHINAVGKVVTRWLKATNTKHVASPKKG